MAAAGAPPLPQGRSGKYAGLTSNCFSSSELADFPIGTNGIPTIKLAPNSILGELVNRVIKGFYANSGNYPFISNVRIANYFLPSDFTHPTTNVLLQNNGILTAPIAFDSQVSTPTNPYYQYTCFDAGREIKARIRVLVRKWNTVAELHRGGNPNISGTTPTGDPLNDYFGWRDFADPVSSPSHGPGKFPDTEE